MYRPRYNAFSDNLIRVDVWDGTTNCGSVEVIRARGREPGDTESDEQLIERAKQTARQMISDLQTRDRLQKALDQSVPAE